VTDAIKTKTNCPTCGAECTVEGKTTHYYAPSLERYKERLKEWLEKNHFGADVYLTAIDYYELMKAIQSGELDK
jgi:hypothetical protein